MKDKRKLLQIKKLKMCKPDLSSNYRFSVEWWDDDCETSRTIMFEPDSSFTQLTDIGHDIVGQVILYILLESIENSEKFRKKFKTNVLEKLNQLEL
jgi:hypothetical protein